MLRYFAFFPGATMSLQIQTLGKFAREALVTTTALTPSEGDVKAIKKRLVGWFTSVEELTLAWRDGQQGWGYLARNLCTVTIKDPHGHPHYNSLWLGLSAEGELTLAFSYSERRPVGSLDELLEFFRLCRERAAKLKGQHARAAKVRRLRGAAILGRVRDLARTQQFDFATARENQVHLNLSLRFDGRHVVEVRVPFAKFEELLPALEAALPQLRDLARAGVSAAVRPDYSVHARRLKWTLHQTLGQDEADDPQG
jgi:hypothetical protein